MLLGQAEGVELFPDTAEAVLAAVATHDAALDRRGMHHTEVRYCSVSSTVISMRSFGGVVSM